MEENTSEYFSTMQVSRELRIDLAVLKKISYSIEKIVEDKGYYYRNSKNQRLYRSDQIDEIENILNIKKKKKVSYSVAIYLAFSNQNSKMSNLKRENNRGYQWFENMESFMYNQEIKIEKLTISLEALANLEQNNFRTMQQIDERIDGILNYVKMSRSHNKKTGPKKKKLVLSNPLSTKKVWISKKEIAVLKTKILYLPGIWKAKEKEIEMSSKDKKYYTNYVKNAKKAYKQVIEESRKVGPYYIMSSELKEILYWYEQFYDYINQS